MSDPKPLSSLWHSLSFTARLAALASLLVILTMPITLTNVSRSTSLESTASIPGGSIKSGCQTGGCASELCYEANIPPMNTICVWRDEYACLKQATCERQTNGSCGWTPTAESLKCQRDQNDTLLPLIFPLPLITQHPSKTRPRFTSTSMPSITRFKSYQTSITAQDSVPTGTLTVDVSNLPTGITLKVCQNTTKNQLLTINCPISGTTTANSGTYPITLRLTDTQGNTIIKHQNLIVVEAALPSFIYRLFTH